jgi:uncharacterized protein YbjT (DUF2867 family)
MNVLVTGGSGYVGGLALQALEEHAVTDLVSLDVRPTGPVDPVTYVTATSARSISLN